MSEQWKPVPGWEGFYEVSNLGRVKSLARQVPSRWGTPQRRRERLLRPHPLPSGYLLVCLFRDGQRVQYLVHRLVLMAFVGPRPDDMQACHNDGDATNNSVSNLRWDTASANTYDKVRHGTHPMASKTHCKRGHAFTPDNTLAAGANGRRCRACLRLRQRQYREQRKNAA